VSVEIAIIQYQGAVVSGLLLLLRHLLLVAIASRAAPEEKAQLHRQLWIDLPGTFAFAALGILSVVVLQMLDTERSDKRTLLVLWVMTLALFVGSFAVRPRTTEPVRWTFGVLGGAFAIGTFVVVVHVLGTM
jgi:hypothetical protein